MTSRELTPWPSGWRRSTRRSPDVRATEEFTIAEAALVAPRSTYSGTHEDAFPGLPVTDECVEITGTTIYRFGDGTPAKNWVETDTASLLQQVGALDLPGPDVPLEQNTRFSASSSVVTRDRFQRPCWI